MASTRSGRRRSSSSGSSRQSNARRRSNNASNNRRPLQDRDTGYRIGSNRRQKSRSVNPRLIIVGVVGILLIIALVFGISSCVRGCSKSRSTKKTTEVEEKVNPVDARVAYGVSADETNKLTTVLDRNEAFDTIAKNANKITDVRLIDLAISEPEAVAFVAGSIKADGSTQPYTEVVSQGDYPTLYTFDARWGYAAYGEGSVGSLGSGPVALSMASMGLSGKNTYDPSVIAQAVVAAKLDTGTTGMDDAFVSNHGTEAGVSVTSLEASSDGMYGYIAEGQPVLIKLKADSGVGSSNAHWALIVAINSDNSITLHDPTSVYATEHPWSLGALSSRTDTAYALTAAEGTVAGTTTTDDQGYATEQGDDSYDEGTDDGEY